MTNQDFEKLLNKRLELIKSILASKGREYSAKKGEDDRLINFKLAALMTPGETPEQALLGQLKKHLVSINMMISELDTWIPTIEFVEEKLGDAINYYILLEALLKERIIVEGNF